MSLGTGKGERLITKQLIGHVILFTLVIFVLAAFQASFFGASGLFPATPDILLAAVAATGLFEGERHGAACGIWAGILAGALGGAGTGLLPVFYMHIGFFTGVLIKRFLSRNLLSWLIYSMMAVTLRGIFSFVFGIVTEKPVTVKLLLLKLVLPEAAVTFVFSVPVYFLIRLCVLPFRTASKTYEMQ